MPDYFTEGFFVNEPAWHKLGTVLTDYPGREEGMVLAGHDFVVVEDEIAVDAGVWKVVPGWKALRKNDDGPVLNVVKSSYGVIQNSTGWDVVDAVVGQGAKYETGITLKDGAVCSVLAWLDEPVQIPGDDAVILPFVNVAWAHDGSAALSARPTSIRTVCWNTQSMAELEGKRLGREYVFRHTKNVLDRIEEAKLVLKGTREDAARFAEYAALLAATQINPDKRVLFAAQLIPMPEEATISPRVKENVLNARAKMLALFEGPTVPEAHRWTAYGLHLVATEYLDHVRGSKSAESKFGRSLLRSEPQKAKMTRLIQEVAFA